MMVPPEPLTRARIMHMKADGTNFQPKQVDIDRSQLIHLFVEAPMLALAAAIFLVVQNPS